MKQPNKSFTIIELLVVIAILGLLTSIILVSAKSSIQKAKYAKIMQYSGSIKHALWDDIRAEWKFDASNADDTSGNNNNGTVGIPVQFLSQNHISPELGNYASLPRDANAYIEVPNKDSLNPTKEITIETWIKLNITSIDRYILYKDQQYFFYIRTFPLRVINFTLVWESGGSDAYEIQKDLLTQKWHHCVATYDGSYMRIFVDAQELGSGLQVSKIIKTNPSGKLYIGGSGNFDGFIDEVRIYGKALTSAEIQKRYAQGVLRHGFTAK